MAEYKFSIVSLCLVVYMELVTELLNVSAMRDGLVSIATKVSLRILKFHILGRKLENLVLS